MGDQAIYTGQKYNNWNGDFNNVKNHRPFDILPTTNLLLSNFIPTNTGVTIKTSLEGTTTTGGYIEFKDPWFIDYQDPQYANQLRNRGMNEAVPRQRTSPFYPNATTQYDLGQTYKGVFLDREISPNNSYYKVGVPVEQPLTIHGQSRLFYPYKWDGSGVNYQDIYNSETGVVFTSSSANATAVLKGQLMSNTTSGISNNSQRKFVRTDNGLYHLVYESMNCIWLVTNADNWWAPEIKLASNAKNPSIDHYNDVLSIAYEMWENGQLKLGFMQMNANLSIIYTTSFVISTNQNDFGILKPVVSCAQNQQFIIYKPNANSNLKYRLRTLHSNNQWVWSQEYNLPNTNQNTLSWSVASNKVAEYHIAFQQGATTIFYMHADPNGTNILRFCSLMNLSLGTGYNYNQNPSISYFLENDSNRVLVS